MWILNQSASLAIKDETKYSLSVCLLDIRMMLKKPKKRMKNIELSLSLGLALYIAQVATTDPLLAG